MTNGNRYAHFIQSPHLGAVLQITACDSATEIMQKLGQPTHANTANPHEMKSFIF